MSIKLITQLNPFSKNRTIEETECSTIDEIIKKIDTHKAVNTGWRILVNDEIVTDYQRQLKDGDTVYIKLVPEGSRDVAITEKIGGGLLTVVGIGVWILSGGALAQTGIALILSGVSIFASGVSLYNTPDTKLKDNRSTQSPSIRGSRNQSRPMGYVPVLFGKRRIYADNASSAYTWIDDDGNQYLYQLFCVAQKDIHIDTSTLKIGDTDIKEFSATKDIAQITNSTDPLVRVDISYGRNRCPADFQKCVHEEIFNKIIKKVIDDNPGDIPYTTPDNTETVMIDFFAPNGLGQYDDKGKLSSISVTTEVLYRYTDSESAEYISLGTVTLSAAELKTKRARIYKVLPRKGQVDLLVRRNTDDFNDSKIIGDVYLGSIRSIKTEDAVSSTRSRQLTLIALRLKATEKINNFVETFNFVAQSYLPSYDSVSDSWITKLSSNPASAAMYAMQGEMVQQKLDDNEIDWNSFKNLYIWCKNHGYECNEYVYDSVAISELLSNIGSTCRAEIVRQFGKLTVIHDIEKTGFTQIFTPRNSWDYQEQILFPSIPDALSIGFIDKEIGYAAQELKVYNTPSGNRDAEPDTVQDVNLWGVTSSVQARKLGMYKYAVTKHRPFIHKFSADFEYLLCQKGDWIKYAGDIALAGLAQGRIVNVTRVNDLITGIIVDEEFLMEPGKQYSVRIRKNDGSAIIKDIINSGTASKVIQFAQAFKDDVNDNDLVVFGLTGQDSIDLIVTDIQCGDDLTADIIAVEYAPEIFGVDNPDFVLPDFENKISAIPGTQDAGDVNQSDWQTFLTYHDDTVLPSRPTGNGTSDGWHRNLTTESKWMSLKTAATVNLGDWSEPSKIYSQSGKDGTSTLSSTYSATEETTSIPRNTVFATIPPKVDDVIIANSLLFIIKNVSDTTLTVEYQYSIKGSDGTDGTKIFTSDYTPMRSWTNAQWNDYTGRTSSTTNWPNMTKDGIRIGDIFIVPVKLSEKGNVIGQLYCKVVGEPFVESTTTYNIPCQTLYGVIPEKGEKGATGAKGDKGDKGNTGSRAIRYLGKSTSIPNSSNQTSGVPSGLSTPIVGDWYLCNNTSTIGTSSANGGGFVYYCTAISGSTYTWAKVTSADDYRLAEAVDDLLILYKTYTDSSKTIPTPMKTICENYIDALAVGTLLANKIFAKTINIQTGGVIKSSNYASGTAGFKINANGSVEFNNITMQGISIIASILNNLAFGRNNYNNGTSITGKQNVAIGYNALQRITSGNSNFAAGINCGTSITEGSNNIAIGNNCLSDNKTGSNNIAIGESALGSMNGGSSNICIGKNTGTAITTGSNNICIGDTANVQVANATRSNQINIGNRIFVDYNGAVYKGTSWTNKTELATVNLIPSGVIGASAGSNINGSYFKFTNGLIIEWGQFSTTETGTATSGATQHSFPVAFTSTPRVIANNSKYYANNDYEPSTCEVRSITTTSFYAKVSCTYSYKKWASNVDWIAIGY